MPILIKNFSWSQSPEEIIIRIPIPGIISKNISISVCKSFVKINHPPYFFETFLQHDINEKESRCRVMENEVICRLKKVTPSLEWDELEQSLEKEMKLEVKGTIEKEIQELSVKESKERAERKEEKKREEIRNEIERDSNRKEAIETIHNTEWSSSMATIVESPPKIIEPSKFIQPAPVVNTFGTPMPKSLKPSPPQIPFIRNAGNITVNFTKRNFTTPLRESQTPAEMEWLTKQHEARKTIGFIEEDLRPEERNPEYLKLKGDEFYAKKNYLGAISAYSTGIRLTETYADLFLNRSAAHFAIENYQRCVEDCSKAFDLLTPAVDSNLAARIQCLTRRANALFKLGFTREAYGEFVAAVKLNPSDEELKRDAEMMRCKIERGLI